MSFHLPYLPSNLGMQMEPALQLPFSRTRARAYDSQLIASTASTSSSFDIQSTALQEIAHLKSQVHRLQQDVQSLQPASSTHSNTWAARHTHSPDVHADSPQRSRSSSPVATARPHRTGQQQKQQQGRWQGATSHPMRLSQQQPLAGALPWSNPAAAATNRSSTSSSPVGQWSDADMDAVIRDPVSNLLRSSGHATTRGTRSCRSASPSQQPQPSAPAGLPPAVIAGQASATAAPSSATTTAAAGTSAAPSATACPSVVRADRRSPGRVEDINSSSVSSFKSISSTSNGSSGSSKVEAQQPFSRNEAMALEACLSSFKAGSLLHAQQQHVQHWGQQQQRQWLQQCNGQPVLAESYQLQLKSAEASSQQQQQQQLGGVSQQQWCDLLCAQVVPWQQQLTAVAQQLTAQVSVQCVEHGRTLAALQERYAECCNALFVALSSLQQHHTALGSIISGALTAASTAGTQAAQLQQQLAVQAAAAEDVQGQLSAALAMLEQSEQEGQQTAGLMQQQLVAVRQQLYEERQCHEQQQAAAEAAAADAADGASRRLCQADDELLELKQRLCFVHAQLAVVRKQLLQVPVTRCAAVQTDPMQQQDAGVSPSPELCDDATDECSSSEPSDDEDMSQVDEEAAKVVDLLPLVRLGHKRSKMWLLKLLGQVTADKAVADAVADRQGLTRSSLKDFMVAWSLNRYGLQHLSAQVLQDLCASICHHARAGFMPAEWFAHFCGLSPAVKPKKQQQQQFLQEDDAHASSTLEVPGDAGAGSGGSSSKARPSAAEAEALLGSAAALDFFVFCACQLSYPNSVTALFPEARGDVPLIKSSLVMESLKAAFRYLGDPGGQAAFVAECLGTAAVAAASRPGTSCSSKPGAPAPTPGSLVGSYGVYCAWTLLELLLDKWLIRAWANAQQMQQLRSTIAALEPRLQQQCEAAAAAITAAKGPPAMLTRLQQAYEELGKFVNAAGGSLHLSALLGPHQHSSWSGGGSGGSGGGGGALSSGTAASSAATNSAACAAAGLAGAAQVSTDCHCSSGSPAEGAGALEPLVADATGSSAAEAWQAYNALLSLLQAACKAPREPLSGDSTATKEERVGPGQEYGVAEQQQCDPQA